MQQHIQERVVSLLNPKVGKTADSRESATTGKAPEPRRNHESPDSPHGVDPGSVCVRTGVERDLAWARVSRAVQGVVTNGLSNDYDSLGGVERFLFGAYNSARWTLAKRSIAPMSGLSAPIAAENLRWELCQAEMRMLSRGQGWEYASGVMAWLLWMAGESDDPLPVLPSRDYTAASHTQPFRTAGT